LYAEEREERDDLARAFSFALAVMVSRAAFASFVLRRMVQAKA
jgi:hypothetical protein